jgi:electron transfer flavoprotein alpha/beta subunit
MKAKKKEITEVGLSDLGLSADELDSGLVVESLSLPRQDRLGKVLEGEHVDQVGQLVKALREDEKVL